ncbi:MAG: site-specific integrase [Alcaligenaceae bacterium]|nr:MAG: site-specific integrase [Alcaligenaceae bacterium]
MVVDYLVQFAGKLSVATLKRRLCAIHVEHIDRGLQSPVRAVQVTRALQGICRTYGTAQRQVKAIVKDDLLQLLAAVGERTTPLATARDRALLLVGFAGAFRRSELVALTVADVTSGRHGLELRIRRSKTDQTGKGRIVFIPVAKGSECPAAALREWLEASGIKHGAIFRSVSRSGAIGALALTPQSVALIVKSAMRRSLGGEAAAHVAGHSLRAGYCTEAAQAGLQSHQIREQTGHTSDATLARYIRPVSRRAIPSLL